jgi:hypothetical protein
MFRDIVLGRTVESRVAKSERLSAHSALADRDLPQATVQWLAQGSSALLKYAPAHWLTDAHPLSSRARRNLFRVAVEAARCKDSGNPREWHQGKWIRDNVIRAIDFSALVLESASFDGLTLRSADFSSALVQDCDFRQSHFESCNLQSATLCECRFDSETSVLSCAITDTELRAGGKVFRTNSESEFRVALNALSGDARPKVIAADVSDACRKLIRSVLVQFVQLEPVMFNAVPVDALRNSGHTDREKVALERVVVPQVIAAFCDVSLHAGSRERAEIAKNWRAPVVGFMREGRMTHSFKDVVGRITAKASRYLE